jgi:hypothetical protein
MRYALFFIFSVLIAAADKPEPKITDSQRVTILRANLAAARAFEKLTQTPEYQLLFRTNQDASAALAKVQREAGCEVDLEALECKTKPAPQAP